MNDHHLENADIIRVKKSNLYRWAWLVGLIAFFALVFFMALDADAPKATPPAALGSEALQGPRTSPPDPCGLADVECPQEAASDGVTSQGKPQKVITATVYTYQAVPEQTDGDPCVGALAGVDFCDPPFPIIANNCLPLGTKVQLSTQGAILATDTFTVADRMNPRHGCDVFDILTDGHNFKFTADVTVL